MRKSLLSLVLLLSIAPSTIGSDPLWASGYSGGPIEEFIQSGAIDLNYSRLGDNHQIFLLKPTQFTYSIPDKYFQLAPTRLIVVGQQGGVITDILTSPSLTFLDLQDAHQIALKTMEQLQGAGWELIKSYPSDYPSIEKVLAPVPAIETAERLYSEWRLGTVNASVSVKKRGDVYAKLLHREPEHLYLPQIYIYDHELQTRMSNKVYNKRTSKNGTFNSFLPLAD